MAAKSPLSKEVAGALPFTSLITNSIAAMLAPEISGEVRQSDTSWLFSVAFGFFNLANKTGLHHNTPKKKYTTQCSRSPVRRFALPLLQTATKIEGLWKPGSFGTGLPML